MADTTAKINLDQCQKLAEGKTKIIYALPNCDKKVLIHSKDRITAFNAIRDNIIEGKAVVSNQTTSRVFEYLNSLGIRTHFIRRNGDEETAREFVARRCEMIPIEWVTRRIATGSFLKRNVGVKEGFRFSPPKMELFFKDDAAGDPQWSEEMLQEKQMRFGNVLIGEREINLMSRVTVTVFEVLEKAWASVGCALIDMKIEFGVDTSTGDIMLADVIDSDSWRLWPHGDKRLQVDKQFYRDLTEVTPEDLKKVKENFVWVFEQLKRFELPPKERVVCLLGSASDKPQADKIKKHLHEFGIHCILRVTSAHKCTEETMKIIAQYEGDGIPTIFIAIAGRSNGLGPVTSGNTSYPVINCPPISEAWAAQDIWSSMRLPSGLSCPTVLDPETAALSAANFVGLHNHVVWGQLRVKLLLNHIKQMKADRDLAKA